MAKQTFTAGQTLTAQQMNDLQTNDFNLSVTTQTANYTLVAADKGTREVMNMGSAGTVTVPNSTFNAGDAVWVHSIGSGTISLVAGTGLTLNSSAGTAPTLAQWEGGVVYFTASSSAIFFRGGGTTYGVATGGTSSSITVGGQAYTLLTFTSSGTLTVTKAGLFDVMCVGGGGGGATYAGNSGAGGGSGGLIITTAYFSTNQTVTIGGGGSAATWDSASRYGNASSVGTKPDGVFVPGSLSQCNGGGAGLGNAGGLSGCIAGTSHTGSNNPFGFVGGDSSATTNGGGGGGNTGAGTNGSGTTGGNGGAGYDASSFRGESGGTTTYARGGGGGGSGTNGTPTGAGGANTGNGGGATGATGNNGGSGIILVRFKV